MVRVPLDLEKNMRGDIILRIFMFNYLDMAMKILDYGDKGCVKSNP